MVNISTVAALLAVALEDLEEMRDQLDRLLAKDSTEAQQLATAVAAQLAPQLTAGRRAARARRSK